MVEAKIDPWYSSYQELVADPKSSYNYVVLGKTTFTELGRDNGVNYSAWNSDIRATYYNAIRWYVTGDPRHAVKAVEIFNAWRNLTAVTSNGTESLSGGVGYIMIEAAEIIKSTYSGWSAADINAFKNMLIYPGYSNTGVPSGVSKTNGTFYWKSYQGDPGRHGNQGLSGWRTVMAMGIFLDNEIIYDRALRYIKGLPHRSDDLPYPSGPPKSTSIASSDEFSVTYNTTSGSSIQDYGFDEVMTNYIWETGQCQESSRDQQHTIFGVGLLCSMAEMAWNQGDDLYSHANDRLLLGLEYNMRYNVSYLKTYPDQTSWWIPTVASGEFKEGFDRTGRWYSKAISTTGVGEFSDVRPVFEMPLAHYLGRGLKTAGQVKWITRARDIAIEKSGYEVAGWTNDALGWGALTARRPDGCFGDPISGFDSNGLPVYAMNILPMTIEVENYDHFAILGEGRTYHDASTGNTGGQYRTTDGADIQTCSEGGYNLINIENGEWLTYTVSVPTSGLYTISIRYASTNANGKIKFSFGGADKTAEVAIPFGAPNSSGISDWKDFTIASNLLLTKGVQSMKISFSGASDAFVLNNIKIENGSSTACSNYLPAMSPSFQIIPGINYSYYEGTWDILPNFSSLSLIKIGLGNAIDLTPRINTDNFGLVFDGYIKIATEGEYTFYTTSDDGSRLWIDGKMVVDNDGTHLSTEKSGFLCLGAGYHLLKVEYFDKTGSSDVLMAMYAGPGFSKRVITDLYVSPTVTTNVQSVKNDQSIIAYPNPVSDILNVELPESSLYANDLILRLFNCQGSKMAEIYPKHKKYLTFNFAGYSQGVYYLVYSEKSSSITKQIIKL
jgi:hypothetical protein